MRTLALLLLLLNVLFFVWAKSWLLWLPWQPVQFIQPIQTYHANTQQPTLHLVEEATLDVAPLVTPLTLNDPTNLLATLDKLDAAKSIANEKENDIEEIIVEAPQADIDEVVADLLKANEEADEIDNVVSQDIIADESVRKTTEQVNEIVNAEIEADNDNTEKNTTAEVEAINEVAAAQFKDDPYSALLSLAGTTPLAVKNDNESQPTTMTGQIATEKTMMLVETAAETNQPAESSEPPLQTQTIVCYDVGAFVQSTSAQNAKQWFTQKNITVALEKRERRILRATRVYLPPFQNRQAANVAERQLRQKGITDLMVIGKGKLTNAISLGFYRDQSSVKRRLAELKRKGYYNIETEKRYKNETRYWLSVKIAENNDNIIASFKNMFKTIQLTKKACP